MRMHPLHDKDLDRLSRNAAEHYEMDFGPSGWERLEKRLDQELPQQKKRRRFLFWLLFIVVTTGGALTGLLINSQPVVPLASNQIQTGPAQREVNRLAGSDEHINTPEAGANNPAIANGKPATPGSAIKPVTPAAEKPSEEPAGGQQPVAPGSITGVDKAKTPRLNSVTKKPATVVDNKPVTGKQATKKPAITKNIAASNKPAIAQNKPVTNKSIKALNKPVTYKPIINKNKPVTAEPTIAHINPAIPGSPPTLQPPVFTPENTASPSKTTPSPDSTAAAKPPAIPHQYKQPIELGVVAGPDISTVSFGPLYKTGYNVGISVGYRFNDRWSINASAIYTRKYYQADSNTFHAPKHTYIDYVDLDVLKGYCAMWDFPVNIRYEFSLNDKRRFFASAGASTYLMKHQRYNYWYWQRGTGIYSDSSWGSDKIKRYAFSVLNLSVGYEKMVSKHFSIQAEPYIKIPLQGMGFGNMKIGSYGMLFSLKYRPVFKAKQASKK